MFPLLFAWGPVSFRTINLFLIFAFLSAAFIFWRKSKEEHYEESVVFDGFLQSSFVGLLVARLAFIAFHFPTFQFNLWHWLDLVGHAGYMPLFGLLASGLYLYRYAAHKKWDVFEILDFWVLGMSLGLVFSWLGAFFDGSGFGVATSMPWGMVFPGVFEKHHPIQLYFVILYGALFWYLSWADFHYRTFGWYRAGKNTAQTGYLTSVFLIISSLFSAIIAWWRPPQFAFNNHWIDIVVYGSLCFAGCLLLWSRSGRTMLPSRARR